MTVNDFVRSQVNKPISEADLDLDTYLFRYLNQKQLNAEKQPLIGEPKGAESKSLEKS